MFDSLSDKLERAFKVLKGQGQVTEINVAETVKEIRKALLDADVDMHALLPGTGSGVAKIAFDSRPATYRIKSWGAVPPLMQFMQSIGVSLVDCLKSFNWGMGYYVFVPKSEVERVLAIGRKEGYELSEVGAVEEGERQVIFEPENIVLPPPGE